MLLRVFILVIAGSAAGGAAWLTLQAGANEPAPVVATRVEPLPTADVLVAAADITGGQVLSPDKLRWEPWPEQNVNSRFVTRAARPEAIAELAGTFVNGGFVAGEPIREERLMQANANLLSNRIEPGKRAVAVKVSAESAAGGFILPGDRVDVIQTSAVEEPESSGTRNESRIIISNARVMAIDQTAVQTPEGSVLGKTATLELTPAEAERVMAAEAVGQLSLALRAITDHAEIPMVVVETVRTVRVNRAAQRSTVTVH